MQCVLDLAAGFRGGCYLLGTGGVHDRRGRKSTQRVPLIPNKLSVFVYSTSPREIEKGRLLDQWPKARHYGHSPSEAAAHCPAQFFVEVFTARPCYVRVHDSNTCTSRGHKNYRTHFFKGPFGFLKQKPSDRRPSAGEQGPGRPLRVPLLEAFEGRSTRRGRCGYSRVHARTRFCCPRAVALALTVSIHHLVPQ